MNALQSLSSVSHDFVLTVLAQIRNVAPVPLAVIGAKFGIINLDTTLMVLGILYVLVQIGYLVWKWKSEYRKNKRRKAQADAQFQATLKALDQLGGSEASRATETQ